MIEFKAFLGEHGGLHFACTRIEGDSVLREWGILDEWSRELTGMAMGPLIKMIECNTNPNPMSILALILDETLCARIEQEHTPLYVRDDSQPDGRRFVKNQLRSMTIVAWLTGEGDEGD